MKKLFEAQMPTVFFLEADTEAEAKSEFWRLVESGDLDFSGFRGLESFREVTHSGWAMPEGWGEETIPLNSQSMMKDFLSVLPTKSPEPVINEPSEPIVDLVDPVVETKTEPEKKEPTMEEALLKGIYGTLSKSGDLELKNGEPMLLLDDAVARLVKGRDDLRTKNEELEKKVERLQKSRQELKNKAFGANYGVKPTKKKPAKKPAKKTKRT